MSDSHWYESWVRERAEGRPLWRVQLQYRSSGEVWWQNLPGAIADHDRALEIVAEKNRTGYVARAIEEVSA